MSKASQNASSPDEFIRCTRSSIATNSPRSGNTNSDGTSLLRKRSGPYDDNEQDQFTDIQPSQHQLRVKKTVKRQKHSVVQINEPRRNARVLERKFQDTFNLIWQPVTVFNLQCQD